MESQLAGALAHANNSPIKALLLDDDAFDRSRIRRLAEKSELPIVLEEVQSISAMSHVIDKQAFDLVFLDYRLAEGNGLEALEIIKDQPMNCNAAIIMVSGDESSSTAVSAFRQGCHDFVTKHDMSSALLEQSVYTALNRVRDNSQIGLHLDELLTLKVQSALTTALNSEHMHATFIDVLQRAAKSAGIDQGGVDPEFWRDFIDAEEFIFKS